MSPATAARVRTKCAPLFVELLVGADNVREGCGLRRGVASVR